MSKKRKRISPRKDKKVFGKTAKKVHPKNMLKPMRGSMTL